jgi:hypothetical protein
MRPSRVALALVSIGCAIALDVRAAELEGGEAPQLEEAPAAACPVVDSLGDTTLHFFEYPAEQTSLFQAEHVAPDDSRRPGAEGVTLIKDLIVSSMRPGCTPIRLVVLVGGADFDSRGPEFEDSVSVKRTAQARNEFIEAVGSARSAAAERGDFPILSVKFSGGGIGTRAAARASTEEGRRANRVVQLRLVQVAPAPAEPQLDTATGAPASGSETQPLD